MSPPASRPPPELNDCRARISRHLTDAYRLPRREVDALTSRITSVKLISRSFFYSTPSRASIRGTKHLIKHLLGPSVYREDLSKAVCMLAPLAPSDTTDPTDTTDHPAPAPPAPSGHSDFQECDLDYSRAMVSAHLSSECGFA